MSSFRIDRQYVSFITAETKSVISHVESDAHEADPFGRDDRQAAQDRYCAELMDKALKDAERKAALFLEKAEAEADGIVQKARKTAGETTEEARNQAASIREEARRLGYAEGLKAAEASAAERKKEEAKEYAQLIRKLQQTYTDLVDGMREDIISLVINIVKKVIDFKINHSDEIFLGIVNHMLEQLKHAGTVMIHVSSEDYRRYFGKDAANGIRAGDANVIVTEEEGFSPGDLVAESEGEMLDFSIGKQIERVEKAISQEGV